jgi:pantoate kinase
MALCKKQTCWILAIKMRLKATSEMLGSMKGIKMSGLAGVLFTRLTELRTKEIISSRAYRSLQIFATALGEESLKGPW